MEVLEAEVDKPSGSVFLLCPIEQWGEDSRLFSPVVFAAPTESLGSHNTGEPSPTKLP